VWRVVVADQRSPRDGRVIETIGHYNAQTQPSTVVIDGERARSWLERGAQPSRAVRKLLRIQESAALASRAPREDAAPDGTAGGEAPTPVAAAPAAGEAGSAGEAAPSAAEQAPEPADEAAGAER
jgi:small subunit ribosomal protein S16